MSEDKADEYEKYIVLRAKILEGVQAILAHGFIRNADFEKVLELMDNSVFGSNGE